MTLIRMFASKCKYCQHFRVTPDHLRNKHRIPLESFTIESVYLNWKSAKKAWKKLKRELIIENGRLSIQKDIEQLSPHLESSNL